LGGPTKIGVCGGGKKIPQHPPSKKREKTTWGELKPPNIQEGWGRPQIPKKNIGGKKETPPINGRKIPHQQKSLGKKRWPTHKIPNIKYHENFPNKKSLLLKEFFALIGNQ